MCISVPKENYSRNWISKSGFFFFLTFVSRGAEESTKSFTVCCEIICTEAQSRKEKQD